MSFKSLHASNDQVPVLNERHQIIVMEHHLQQILSGMQRPGLFIGSEILLKHQKNLTATDNPIQRSLLLLQVRICRLRSPLAIRDNGARSFVPNVSNCSGSPSSSIRFFLSGPIRCSPNFFASGRFPGSVGFRSRKLAQPQSISFLRFGPLLLIPDEAKESRAEPRPRSRSANLLAS